MPIKEYSKETPRIADDWQGAWGSIAATPHSVTTLCVEIATNARESYSYPYRSLVRWTWKEGEPETLEVLSGKDRIVLTGKGLRRLQEALDSEQLERIRVRAISEVDEVPGIYIQSIQIEEIE